MPHPDLNHVRELGGRPEDQCAVPAEAVDRDEHLIPGVIRKGLNKLIDWARAQPFHLLEDPRIDSAKVSVCVFPWHGALVQDGQRGLRPTASHTERENPHEDARASGGAHFLHDVLDVLFDRLFGNFERVRDSLVRMPLGQIADHPLLAGREMELLPCFLGGAHPPLGNLLHEDENTPLQGTPAMIWQSEGAKEHGADS
jgi:hypothetical protein